MTYRRRCFDVEIRSNRLGRAAAWFCALAFIVSGSGCNNAIQGGATGAGLGALVGMGLGSLSGDMGKGAAAGALLGGLGGLVIGDQNARYSGGGWGGSCGSRSWGGGCRRWCD